MSTLVRTAVDARAAPSPCCRARRGCEAARARAKQGQKGGAKKIKGKKLPERALDAIREPFYLEQYFIRAK